MPPADRSNLYPLIGLVWFVLALLAGASGWLVRVPFPGPQILLLALTAGLVVAAVAVASFRAWLLALDIRTAIAVHLVRFVGIYFLLLYREGLLPFQFAVPGGWGDIAIAVTAVLWLLLTRRPMEHPWLLFAWNVLGLIDIVFVVLTAARIGAADPHALAPLRVLPLSLLPTFFVPLILGSHFLIFWRLRPALGRR